MPVVSILVPVYNVEDYLRECLDSLLAQTLSDIEVIAINDGSTDASSAILRDYAARDARIQIIDKPNTGYGDSMNRGLAQATGDYIGIVEPDDFIERDMYETLVETARRFGADFVKCNYFEHESAPGSGVLGWLPFWSRDRRVRIYEEFQIPYEVPISPRVRPEVLTVRPCIWAGVYRRDFLEANQIDFAPTPGASFQDTSFAQKCWIAADTAVVCSKPLLHYRIDNASSSVKSEAKVFAICDEYARTMEFLRRRGDRALETFAPTINAMRYCSYIWNYNRIAPEFREGFARRWADEMCAAAAEGLLDRALLKPADQHALDVLMVAPGLFCERHPDGIEWQGYRVEGWQGSEARETGHAGAVATTGASAASVSPTVSIIIPVYGVEEFIRECLESLLAQTFTDFEAILIDDGSTDASMPIARMVVGDDPRFRIIEKENGGQSSARNCGIEVARGEYIAFLDPDDYYAPNALERLVGHVRADDLDYLDFTAHCFYDTARAKRLCNEDYYEQRPAIEGTMSGPELFVAYQQAREYHCSVCFHLFKRDLLDAQDGLAAGAGEGAAAGAGEGAGEGVGADSADNGEGAAANAGKFRGPLRFEEGIIHEDELFSPLLIARARRAAYLPEALYQRRVREGSAVTTKRGMRNVRDMFAVQRRLREFAIESAPASDTAYTAALSQRIAELREIIARDAATLPEAELAAYAETLDAPARVEFEIVAIEGARSLARMLAGADMRLGGALLKGPRWVKHRIIT